MSSIKSPLFHEMKASLKPLNSDNFINRHENSPTKTTKKKDPTIKPNSLINFLGVKSENKSKVNDPLKYNNNDKQCSLEEELESCNINEQAPFKPKTNRIKEGIMHTLSEDSKKRISCVLDEVYQLSDVEKLLLYLQLPTGLPSDKDLLKQRSHCMSLGKKAEAEVNQTYSWIQSHLEEDPNISLPKQEVYNEYKAFCEANDSEALCAADFGKVMKHVFPGVKPRRLGTRGNSRYCYSGLRKKLIVETPTLPNLLEIQKPTDSLSNKDFSNDVFQSTFHLIMEWAEKLLGRKFSKLEELACYLVESSYVDNRSVAAYTLLSATDNHHLLDKEIQANSSKVSNGKKRESQIHLQRKLHEKELLKEQKKKLQEQKCQFSKSPRKTTKPRSISQPQFDFTDDFKLSGDTNSSELELVDAAEDIKLSPKAILDKASKSDINCDPVFNKAAKPDQQRTAKIGIPRNCSSGAICIKPPNLIVSPLQITVLNTQPSVPQKYKPIQPKPFSARSQITSTPINFSNNSAATQIKLDKAKKINAPSLSFSLPEDNENTNIIKREDRSLSVLETFSSMKSQDILPDTNCLLSEIKSERKSKSPEHIMNSVKRHSDEMDTNELASKKPYLGGILSSREILDSDNSPWTNSECHEMLGGLNVSKLSKDIISLKKPLELDEVSLHQIETDANLEYFNDIDIEAMNEPINSTLNPTSTNAGPNENNELQIVQLRMLLKQNLPSKVLNSPKSQDLYNTETSDTNNELRKALFPSDLKTLYSSNSQQPLLIKNNVSTPNYVESFKRDKCIETSMNSQTTLVPSIPDTRRLAFNFQPISHRQTPIAENFSTAPSPQITYIPSSNMISVAVGPSRPTSAGNSPFVSPRTTPIPTSRSRNNSGQNNPRHTPFQNFDSGVSSVSSSPFISPQPTPLPGPHRLRHNSSLARSISFSTNQAHSLYNQHRARHSSGPGGPIGMHSPMMHDVRSNSVDTSLLRSRHNSNSTTILSPVPEQALKQQQPQLSSSFIPADDINKLAADDFLRSEHLNIENTDLIHNALKSSLSPNSNPLLNNSDIAPQMNLKHFNNDLIDLNPCDSISQEVQSYLKNSSYSVSLANRSQSVPLHQMLQPFSKQCPTTQMTENESFSKSYPSTPVGNQMFIFETERANLTENFPPESSNAVVIPDTWEPLPQKTDTLDQSSEEDFQSALEALQDFGGDFKFELAYNAEGDLA